MIILLFALQAWAQENLDWLRLQEARLMLSEPMEQEESIDIFNEILAAYPVEDPLYLESLYWKGRALSLMDYHEHSRDKLIEVSDNYSMRPIALYFLQQSGAWKERIQKIPYSGNPLVNVEGKHSLERSLALFAAFDANASHFQEVSISFQGDDFPLYITVELVDWRNERWVWREEVRDASQPLSLRVEQFRSPREEKNCQYRGLLISGETIEGRRIPIQVKELQVK
jgi:hypothetical protein